MSTKKLSGLFNKQFHNIFKDIEMQDFNTKSVSKTIFDFILDNPGCKSSDVSSFAISRGIKTNTSSSIISILISANYVKRENGIHHAIVNEYKPIKKEIRDPSSKIIDTPRLSAEYIVTHLPVAEAKALYRELKEIFEND